MLHRRHRVGRTSTKEVSAATQDRSRGVMHAGGQRREGRGAAGGGVEAEHLIGRCLRAEQAADDRHLGADAGQHDLAGERLGE